MKRKVFNCLSSVLVNFKNNVRFVVDSIHKMTFKNEITIEIQSFTNGENRATFIDTVADLFSENEYYRIEKKKYKNKGYLKFPRTFSLGDTILSMGFIDKINNTASQNLISFLNENKSKILVVYINDKSQFSRTGLSFIIKKNSDKWSVVK